MDTRIQPSDEISPPPRHLIPAIHCYTIELAPLLDGGVYLGITTTLSEHEGEIENMDLGVARGSLEDAFALMRRAVVFAEEART